MLRVVIRREKRTPQETILTLSAPWDVLGCKSSKRRGATLDASKLRHELTLDNRQKHPVKMWFSTHHTGTLVIQYRPTGFLFVYWISDCWHCCYRLWRYKVNNSLVLGLEDIREGVETWSSPPSANFSGIIYEALEEKAWWLVRSSKDLERLRR